MYEKKWYDLTEEEINELIDFMEDLQIPIEGEDKELSLNREIHWSNLSVATLCFFMDCKLPNDWNKYYREFYTLEREIYLSLYGVLKSSWREISLEARHKNFDIPKKPIQLLMSIIDADDLLESVKFETTNKDFSANKFHRLGKKVSAIGQLPKNKQSDVKRKAWEGLPDEYERIKSLEFFCIHVASLEKRAEVKRAISKYNEAISKRSVYFRKITHPQTRYVKNKC